jgi:hypothetical protein
LLVGKADELREPGAFGFSMMRLPKLLMQGIVSFRLSYFARWGREEGPAVLPCLVV